MRVDTALAECVQMMKMMIRWDNFDVVVVVVVAVVVAAAAVVVVVVVAGIAAAEKLAAEEVILWQTPNTETVGVENVAVAVAVAVAVEKRHALEYLDGTS